MIKILFICHGNICRSTMAESVMTYLVEKEGLADRFYINSAATSREEIGNGVHHGTVAKLKKEGIPVIPHRAVQMTLNDYEEYDYLIGMDTENIRNMQRISGGDPDEKIYKLLTFREADLMWQTHGIREILRQLTGMFWQAAKDCLNALRKNCRRLQAGYMSKCHGNICE